MRRCLISPADDIPNAPTAYYGDVHVDTISKCVRNPGAAEAWQWRCGFYPGSHPGEQRGGTAGTFDQARAEFETAWRVYLPKRSEADFQAWRDQQAWRRKNIATLIAASRCRRIGGLVNCVRQRAGWPRASNCPPAVRPAHPYKAGRAPAIPVAKTACAAAGAAV
jgi:hypothetical protein